MKPCVIDQWLCAARFFKTRAPAVAAVKNGRVLINGRRNKPARLLAVGDILNIQKTTSLHMEVYVAKLASKRVAAKIAAGFYRETDPGHKARLAIAAAQKLARQLVAFPAQWPDKRAAKIARSAPAA